MAAGRRRRTRPSALLLLLCLVLGATIYYEVTSDHWSRLPPMAAARAPVAVVLPEPLPEFQLPPLSEFAGTVERPLFLSDRRPPEPDEVVEAAPEKTRPLQVIVTGVILSEAGRFALVRREGAAEVFRLAARDTIDGWSVKEVLADRVIFERDEDSLEVELKDLTQPQAAPSRGRDGRRPGPAGAESRATPSRSGPGAQAAPSGSADGRRGGQSNGN